MSVRIEPATVDFLLEHATELFEAHRDEIATMPDLMKVKPDVDAYKRMEASDALYCLSALDGVQLVGYSVNVVIANLHYSDLKTASNDLLYVHPDYRHGRLGLRLMRETENEAQRRGAHLMLWHAKQNSALSHICQRLGYSVQDVIYNRRLV